MSTETIVSQAIRFILEVQQQPEQLDLSRSEKCQSEGKRIYDEYIEYISKEQGEKDPMTHIFIFSLLNELEQKNIVLSTQSYQELRERAVKVIQDVEGLGMSHDLDVFLKQQVSSRRQ